MPTEAGWSVQSALRLIKKQVLQNSSMVEQSQDPAELEIINAFENLGYFPHLVGPLVRAVVDLGGLNASFELSPLDDGRLVYTLTFEPNFDVRQETVQAISFFVPSPNGCDLEVVAVGETHRLERIDAVLERPQEGSFAIDFCCDNRFGTNIIEVERNPSGVFFRRMSAFGNLRIRSWC